MSNDGPNRIDLEYLRKRLPEVADLVREASDAARAAEHVAHDAASIEADLAALLNEAFLRPGIAAPIRVAMAEAPELFALFTATPADSVSKVQTAMDDVRDIEDLASVLAAGLAAAIVAGRRRASELVDRNKRLDMAIVCDDGGYTDETHRAVMDNAQLTMTMNPLGTRMIQCGTPEEWDNLREQLRACARPATALLRATMVTIRPPGVEEPEEEDGAS